MARVEKNTATTKRLSFWILLFLLLSVLDWLIAALVLGRGAGRVIAYVQIGLLVGLFGILVFLPSDARERERLIDTEAATATLGITFWTAMMYGGIANWLDLPRSIAPGAAVLFMFVTYIVAKALVELRHR